jgi:hypothetical protein
MNMKPKLRSVFQRELTLSVGEYCSRGIAYLSGVRNCYERGILEVLSKIKG